MNFFEEKPFYKTYSEKTETQKNRINESLEILFALGLPVGKLSPRRREMLGLCFLAICDIRPDTPWTEAKSLGLGGGLRTRGIIQFINTYYGEKVSEGSYDDIRRVFLLWPRLANIAVETIPSSATNSPVRGYALNDHFYEAVTAYGSNQFTEKILKAMAGTIPFSEVLTQPRQVELIEVALDADTSIALKQGEHNKLQAEIVHNFLPRFGFGAKVLYIGDATTRLALHTDQSIEAVLGTMLSDKELPDVVAYSEGKGWIYLIEAVHSANPITPERILLLEAQFKNAVAPIVYVTCFPDRQTFRKFSGEIAWETEVWIAEEPDHLIHFNGDKFLGPHLNP